MHSSGVNGTCTSGAGPGPQAAAFVGVLRLGYGIHEREPLAEGRDHEVRVVQAAPRRTAHGAHLAATLRGGAPGDGRQPLGGTARAHVGEQQRLLPRGSWREQHVLLELRLLHEALARAGGHVVDLGLPPGLPRLVAHFQQARRAAVRAAARCARCSACKAICWPMRSFRLTSRSKKSAIRPGCVAHDHASSRRGRPRSRGRRAGFRRSGAASPAAPTRPRSGALR